MLLGNPMQKHIWLISFWYPPINWTASERALKFARSFVKAGWKVTVFTADTARFDRQHLDLDREIDMPEGDDYTVIRVPVWFAGTSFGRRDRQFIGRLKRSILGRIITPIFGDSGWIWAVPLYRALRKQIKHFGPPDYVLASGPPFMSFWVVQRICRMHIPYALDYRDLWSGYPHSGRFRAYGRRIARAMEARVNAAARMLITVSEGCAANLRKNNSVVTLRNYPDKSYLDFAQHNSTLSGVQLNPQHFNMVYAGTLYYCLNLDSIARAIKELEPAQRAVVRLHYYGLSERLARKSFDKYDVANNLLVLGNVNKQTIMAAMKEADLLVSVVYNVDQTDDLAINGIMTTKIFDYLISGAPIINIAPKTNELYKWLEAQAFNGVLNVTAAQTPVIRDHIVHLLGNKGGVCRRTSYPDSLLWEHQAKEVIDRITAQVRDGVPKESGRVKGPHE